MCWTHCVCARYHQKKADSMKGRKPMEEHHIPQAVQIRNAHVHNLKNIDVDIPLHQIAWLIV